MARDQITPSQETLYLEGQYDRATYTHAMKTTHNHAARDLENRTVRDIYCMGPNGGRTRGTAQTAQ